MSSANYEVVLTNRLGNRAINQDRIATAERGDALLLMLADGMGGHARGELAAQTLIDSVSRSFRNVSLPVSKPENFLQQALKIAHQEVAEAGRHSNPPIEPRTTAVICLIQGSDACWAHLGDSRLYYLRDGEIIVRTRDHSYVEDLLRSGKIKRSEVEHHPMRNTVTQCVGGSKSAQTPAFDSASLEPGDELLLCSDGLWNSLKESLLIKALEEEDLDQAADQLADQAELSSYPHSDNISLIAFRYLTNNSAEESEKPIVKPTPSQQGGSLDQALDEIERALDKYGSEMGDPK